MNFQECYHQMQIPIVPSPKLIQQTLDFSQHRSRPLRQLAAAGIAAAVLLTTPALAAQTEFGYQLMYLVSPAAAQFFQPVRERCTDQGVTMEVIGVRVDGDTAQAWISLSGAAVDETTDLFDSYSFHLPFDQSSHCERVNWDEETQTVTFLCTTETMDGSSIPTGSKMTFSVRQLLTGKEVLKGAKVDLNLKDYTEEAETAATWNSEDDAASEPESAESYYFPTGGNGPSVMLLPGEVLAEPAKGLPITAAGYADGLFHIQLCQGDATRLDNHAQLWLENATGTTLTAAVSYFTSEADGKRMDYIDFVFDIPPEELGSYALYGNFYTASTLTEGLWRVTFPLENSSPQT